MMVSNVSFHLMIALPNYEYFHIIINPWMTEECVHRKIICGLFLTADEEYYDIDPDTYEVNDCNNNNN
uniref:Uncharacterized protein n=1 Tax=Strigamia maritima TaxID=126957 RepID=T1IKG7_STRMM